MKQLLRLCKDFSTEVKSEEGVARLFIRRVYPEDEGEYTCVAYNQLGSDSTSACLIVDGSPVFFQLKFQFKLKFLLLFQWLTIRRTT